MTETPALLRHQSVYKIADISVIVIYFVLVMAVGLWAGASGMFRVAQGLRLEEMTEEGQVYVKLGCQ